MMEHLITALKGFLMGAANVVPGVSGGTMALITGIYKDLVDAINGFASISTWKILFRGDLKGFWKAIKGPFLLSIGIGVVLSIFSLAKLMTFVLETYPVHTWSFFFGLIVASAVLMFRGIKGWGLKDVLFTIAGIILGVVVCTLSPTETPDGWWFIFLCGAIAICTMILPGISGSFILVILSKYEYIMRAVSDLNIPVLTVFGLGCIIGILAFSKFLHWLLARAERQTMLVLLGFVLGSLVKVWPWANEQASALPELHVGAAVIWCLIGIAVVAVIEILAKYKSKQ